MANSPSAEKRIEVNKRNQLRNKAYKSTVRTIYKKSLIAINNMDKNDIGSVNELVSLSYSKLDKAVQKGMMHRNAAASKKSALVKALKQKEQEKKLDFTEKRNAKGKVYSNVKVDFEEEKVGDARYQSNSLDSAEYIKVRTIVHKIDFYHGKISLAFTKF